MQTTHITATGHDEMRALGQAIHDTRRSQRASTADLARERILFTNREQILYGDWLMRRVPSQPSLPGETSDARACRTVTYDLPSMLTGR